MPQQGCARHCLGVVTLGPRADLSAGFVQANALLGASVKTIHPDAVPLIRGRRVRIVPHADPAGAKAGLQWAGLLKELGCRVDGFDLRNLAKTDGSPVKDLNDCTAMTPEAQTEMNQLFT